MKTAAFDTQGDVEMAAVSRSQNKINSERLRYCRHLKSNLYTMLHLVIKHKWILLFSTPPHRCSLQGLLETGFARRPYADRSEVNLNLSMEKGVFFSLS